MLPKKSALTDHSHRTGHEHRRQFLAATDLTTVTLDMRQQAPKCPQNTGVHPTGHPGTVRQLVVTGLGRGAPTVLITNEHDLPA